MRALQVCRSATGGSVKHQDLINELRSELSELVLNVEGASAMQMYDLHRLAEGVVLGMFRELFDLPNLRNLNASERKNFPAIDLADDSKRFAIQVTATPTLEKVKETLSTFLQHDLASSYDRLVVYVLIRKQNSYSQSAITTITQGRLDFQPDRDILDYRDLLAKAVDLSPAKVRAAVEVLKSYKRGGGPAGLTDTDFDPPSAVEGTFLNLVEMFFPSELYVGELLPQVKPEGRLGRAHGGRKSIREHLKTSGLWAPTDFEVNARRIITFHPLDDNNNPFATIIDYGTVTPIKPSEFSDIDDDHERVFKSLLRLCLQQKLYKHCVQWKHDDGLFIFVPRQDSDLLREETWTGQKQASRRVFERKLNKYDSDKTFVCKHFAFSVDFVRTDDRWFAALAPDWYFSHGDGYRKSRYADQSLSWLKRKENNRTVTDHFRFLVSWLSKLDADDLFSATITNPSQISFGDVVRFNNHPALDDDQWLPVKDEGPDDPDRFQEARLFDTL